VEAEIFHADKMTGGWMTEQTWRS